jgi:hypothetical protein
LDGDQGARMNLMYSCKRVAELLSQNLDEPLGPIDRLRLRMHLSMCSNCSNVERQLIAMKALSTGLFSSGLEPDGDDGRPTKK